MNAFEQTRQATNTGNTGSRAPTTSGQPKKMQPAVPAASGHGHHNSNAA